ncbi:hypothetical protein CSA37_06675 [Candidatus Fermentibacteria bacterium]|nr:MAG: hypothetical protein CSA37_06675 [Candidatus Fermentibacteria bacterium]
MKTAVVLLFCVFFAVFAARTGFTSQSNQPAVCRGSYTVVNSYPVGLGSAYGLAIMTETPNSIWISQYTPAQINEFDMATGTATGNTWAINGGVDADDMGYCEYSGSPNQLFFGHWEDSWIQVYDVSDTESACYLRGNISGPSAWSRVCGVDAGHGMLYASDFFTNEIAWGPYTGTETTVSWTTAPFNSVSGVAVWGDYLFVCTQETGTDNIFIMEINADGSPSTTPVWSCSFSESSSGPNGGIDYDGTHLWVYPQNENLFELEIDWVSSLQRNSWGAIKSSF